MPRATVPLALSGLVIAGLAAGCGGQGAPPPGGAGAPAPSGLAAAALADERLEWEARETPGFRVYFLEDSYPARHQEELLARLAPALARAGELLEAPPLEAPIDLFFVESRPQMEALIGGRATGFAQPSTRTVLLMTNPDWRPFERHEIMHVAAVQAWGEPAPGTDWLQEGLAQFADGACGGYANAEVAAALASDQGWIPLEDVLTRFRSQPDLRAYLQAAAFVEHLHARHGPRVLRDLWTGGATPETPIGEATLAELERHWRSDLSTERGPTAEELEHIQAVGCG